MPTVQELINAGYGGYVGWDDASANADFNATGGAGKEGGNSSGDGSLPKFNFDQAKAEADAKEQLRPYYERLLQIYDGDVALAKKRMEQDYERGLRYKREETTNALGDVAASKAEQDRKFKLALGDLDQEMNTRGLTTSGIKTTNQQNAQADELFKQNQYDTQARDISLAQKQYEEEKGLEKQRSLENEGFADSGVAGFVNNRNKKVYELANQYEKDVGEKVSNAFNKAYTYNQVAAQPIATAQPTNYVDLINKGLTMSGLPATS